MQPPVFGRKPLNQPAAFVHEMLIPQSAIDSDRTYAAGEALIDFKGYCERRGRYRPDEFPAEIVVWEQAWNYIGVASETGHGAYFSRSQAHPGRTQLARQGLVLVGLDDIARIFDRSEVAWRVLCSKLGDDNADENVSDAVRQEMRAYNTPIFERYWELCARCAEWMKHAPMIRVIPDAGYRAAWERVALANPLRAEREAALEAAKARLRSSR